MNLKDKIIMVTGATGYIGTQICIEILKNEGNLIAIGHKEDSIKKLKKNLNTTVYNNSNNNNFMCFSTDLKKEYNITKLYKKITKKFGYLSGIVNCAYSGKTGDILSIKNEDFIDANNLNVITPIKIVTSFDKLLTNSYKKTKQYASIVNISSIYAIVSPKPENYINKNQINPIHYGASKAALIQITKYLSVRLSKKKIRTNSISPGAIPNPKKINLKFKNKLKKNIPMNRIGTPREVAEPVVFLLSESSSYINGENIIIDGGWTVW
tara:strand:- start:677 stop:1477 length:801 start_codon:yes stop_codon:yes gene_type:complete